MRAGRLKLLLAALIASTATLAQAQIGLGGTDDAPATAEPTGPPDEWITTKVKTALLTTEGVRAARVNVDTVEGLVTLHGTVATAEERVTAENAARSVKGMREVRNLLQVVSASGEEAVAISDEALAQRVGAALRADPALSDSRIGVASVNKGVVLLSGTASSLSNHLRALEVASRVPGASRVASEIESPDAFADAELWHDGTFDLDLSRRSAASDLWITTAVKVQLFETDHTPTYDINVDTYDGVVTLFGVVDSAEAKEAVTAEARSVPGVTKIRNELQVVSPGDEAAVAESDEVVHDAILKRLAARRQLDDARIGVDVKSGVARLSGRVTSQSDRLTALTVTRTTRGVRRLVDELAITR